MGAEEADIFSSTKNASDFRKLFSLAVATVATTANAMKRFMIES